MHFLRRFVVAPVGIFLLMMVHLLASMPGNFLLGNVVNVPVTEQITLSSSDVQPIDSFVEDTKTGFFWKPSSRKLSKLNIQANGLGGDSNDRITMIQDMNTEHLVYSAATNQVLGHPHRGDEILLYDVNKGTPFALNDPQTGPVVDASRVQYVQKEVTQNPTSGSTGRAQYDASQPIQSLPAFDQDIGGTIRLSPDRIWKIVNHGKMLWGIFTGLSSNGGTIYEERFGGAEPGTNAPNRCGITSSAEFLSHSSLSTERFPCDLNGFAFFPQNFERQFMNLPSNFTVPLASNPLQKAGDAWAPMAFQHPEIRYFTFNGILAGSDLFQSFVGANGLVPIEFIAGSYAKLAEDVASFLFGQLFFDRGSSTEPHVYSLFDSTSNQAIIRLSNNAQATQDIVRVDLSQQISNGSLTPSVAADLFKMDMHNNVLVYYQQDPGFMVNPQNSLNKNFDQKIYFCDAALILPNDPAGNPFVGDAFSCGHLGAGRSIQLDTFGGPVTAMKVVSKGPNESSEVIFATDRLVAKYTLVQDPSYRVASFEILDSLDENILNNVYLFNQSDSPVENTNQHLDRFEIYDLEFSEDLNDAQSLFVRDFYAYDEVDRSLGIEEDDRVNRYERRRSTFGQIRLGVLPATQQGNVSVSLEVMNGAELHYREVGSSTFIKIKDIDPAFGRQTHQLASLPSSVELELVLQSPAGVNTIVHRDVTLSYRNQTPVVLPGQAPSIELFADAAFQNPLFNTQQNPEQLTIPVPFEFYIQTDDPQDEVVTLLEKNPHQFGLLDSTPAVDTTGKYTIVPAVLGSGMVVITAQDASGNETEITFYYSVDNHQSVIQVEDRRAPGVALGPVQVDEAQELILDILAADQDGDPLLLTLQTVDPVPPVSVPQLNVAFGAAVPGGPSGLNEEFRWTPAVGDRGIYDLTFRIDDGRGGFMDAIVTVTVGSPSGQNSPPIVRFEDQNGNPLSFPINANVGDTITFSAVASDPDNDPLILSEINNLSPGQLQRTQVSPTKIDYLFLANAPGTFTVDVMADDGRGGITQGVATFIIGAAAVNQAPDLEAFDLSNNLISAPVQVRIGDTAQVILRATDPENDPVTIAQVGTLLGGVLTPSQNPAEATFEFTPDASQLGTTVSATFRAEDDKGATDTVQVSFEVVALGSAPDADPVVVFENAAGQQVQDIDVEAGNLLALFVNASDPDAADMVSLALLQNETPVANPAVITLPQTAANPVEGKIVWAPTVDEVRSTPYEISFQAVSGTKIFDTLLRITVITPPGGGEVTPGSGGGNAAPAPETPSTPVCGDGVAEGREECDGNDFGVNSCGERGGTLKCTPNCLIDASSCLGGSRGGGGGGGGGGGFRGGFPDTVGNGGGTPAKDPIIVNISYDASRALIHNDFDGLFEHIRDYTWLRSDDRRAYWFRPMLALADIASEFDTTRHAGDEALYKEFMKPIGFLIGFGSTLRECFSSEFCRSRRKTGNSPLSRAEMAALTLRLNDVDEDSLEQIVPPPFPDIPRDVWFNPIVGEAKRLSLMTGHEDGLFRAVESINYAEIAQVIWNVWTTKLPAYEVKFKNVRDINKVEKTSEQDLPDGRKRWCFEEGFDAGLVWRTVTENPGALGLIVSGDVLELGEEYCVTYE